MPSSVPMPMPRGFALLLSLAMVMGAIVPFVAPAPARAAPTDLFFSEYIEGSGFSKALEIYNGTGASIDLSAYSVELYSNGSPTASQTVTLSGTLATDDVFVLAHADADAAIQAVTDLVSNDVANFNGNDAIVLRRGTDAVDVIGQVGSDPGTKWGTEPNTTQEHTLVRQASIQAGDTNGADAFDPADEWDAFAQNTFTFIGSHSTATDPTGVGSADPTTVTAGDPVDLTVVVTPGSDPVSTGITVAGDLTPIGGGAAEAFISTDGATFMLATTVAPATPPGDKVITATIADAQGRDSTTQISFTVESAVAVPGLVVSQVYGGGGNSGASLTNDFIEVFNPTDTSVSVDGWSVQYASSSGTSWQVTSLAGTIAAGGYHLVQEAAGSGGTTPLPTPDTTGSIFMSATNGKVALSSTTTALSGSCPTGGAVADLVGYGTADCFEGTGAAPGLSNTTAALRNEDGCQDTDDNAADFTEGIPGPRNSASPLNLCGGPPADAAPSVISTIPADGSVGVAEDASIGVSFSEPVTVSGGAFTIECTVSGGHAASVTGGPSSFQLDPAVDFSPGDTCTVTVLAANVTDQDTDDPPDAMTANFGFSFSVGVVCGNATHLIHQVQGSDLATPIPGSVVTVEGVVVADYQQDTGDGTLRGFFLQEEDADTDTDALTSEGIFVFDGSFGVAVVPGDVVSVTGEVSEFNDLTEVGFLTDVTVCDSGASVTPASVTLPVTDVGDWERWEGMLADFTQTMTVTENFGLGRFGEVVLSSNGRQFQGTHTAAPGAPALAVQDLNARTRIVLDDANTSQNADPTRYPTGGLSASNTLRVGATVDDLTAVVHEGFGSYRLQPVGEITFDGAADRPESPPDVGGRMQVAAFNVLNYFNGNGDGTGFDDPNNRGAENTFEFDRQRTKIIEAIAAMDAEVVGLMEIENDGDTPLPAVADLVDGLNAEVGAGTYAFIDAGLVGTDAIAVAIIYQPAEVSPLGSFAVLDSSVDPRFDEDRNRAALAQSFTETSTGAAFTVAVNHLKSKGSPCGPPDDQPEHLGGNCNGTRTLAAAALADWLATDPTGSGDADAVIIGDLNAYRMETPITTLESAGFTDLLEAHEGDGAYTYVFEGASGNLDHALSNAAMTGQVTDAAPWHINTDEPPVLDYNEDFKSDNHVITLYAPDAFRSSDHDPVLMGLDLVLHAPVITSLDVDGGPVMTGDAVALSATFTDVDGGETHTASVDWGDGTVTDATVDQSADTVSASHAYASAGLYTVTLTVTDSGELSDASTFRYVVVVDPAAGFVTGGGRIATDAGIASFEISVKYQPGASEPEGDVAFELSGLEFESTDLAWLVLDPSSAWVSGDGTVNGQDGYSFLLAVNDGPDRLRMKIWNSATGEVVFDNQAGDPDDAPATEPILNGQISIHADQGPAAAKAGRRPR